MALNELQQKAYDEVINGDSKFVVLLGQAGSGKSYTTSEIIRNWNGSIAITATTNKAAEVLSQMSEQCATTTHRQLGFRLTPIDYKQVLHQVREPKVADLVIVEEISMLPKVLYDELTRLVEEGLIRKVLFLGDPLQLPAVSGGLDINSIEGKVIELKQPMRQDPSKKELMNYLKRLRKAIEDGDEEFDPTPDFEDIEVITSHKEFCKLYNECETNKKILAHRNSIVEKYNKHINGGDTFKKGDEVIIDKPLGNNATNGTIVIVNNVEEDNDKFILEVLTPMGEKYTIYHWKANYKLEEKLEEYKNEDNESAYWNLYEMSFRLKHIYSSTIYKSQGSTYDTVFIDATDLVSSYTAEETYYKKPISYDLFLRLLYVAISRMKSKCYLFLGDKREYKYLLKDNK